MFHSIKFIGNLSYDAATKSYKDEYELTDSDFRCIVVVAVEVVVAGAVAGAVAVAVIQEYTKRNLNVAANLVKFFLYYQRERSYPIAAQIKWAEKHQPLFAPQVKAELDKYLLLL